MKFCVTFRIDGRYTTEVEAKDIEEAKDKAQCFFEAENFGPLEFVESAPVTVEDEHDIIWEA